ncbi:MAG: hypothetical protein JXR57_01830 [Bacteroidales bacterium]|nr:hypothetical protein [Bacteroidales bacterium]
MSFTNFKTSENRLSKEQMKNVKGGMCQILSFNSDGSKHVGYISYEDVQTALSQGASRWCCDSCATASWSIKD